MQYNAVYVGMHTCCVGPVGDRLLALTLMASQQGICAADNAHGRNGRGFGFQTEAS